MKFKVEYEVADIVALLLKDCNASGNIDVNFVYDNGILVKAIITYET